MANKQPLSLKMRIIHRYLGFFLAGVMLMYSISGIVLIFRNTDFLKNEIRTEQVIAANLPADQVGQALKVRNLKVTRSEGDTDYFAQGEYNRVTGASVVITKELPYLLDKITHLHKATTKDTFFFLNIFFGLSLMFFVISAFWMYMPAGRILRKGLLFTAGGIILILIMLFV